MESKSNSSCELVMALDFSTREDVRAALGRIGSDLKWVKVGLQLFCRYGPDIVKEMADMGYRVFLDLKMHDISNQVASGVRSLEGLPVGLLTVHTSGGEEMIARVIEAQQEALPEAKVLGITVLTSFNQQIVEGIGVNKTPEDWVLHLARYGIQSGLHGLVSSPLELPRLRSELGDKPVLLTPGIRPKGASAGDQKRFTTPEEAAASGANFIVVGRPIYQAEDPKAAVQNILKAIG